MLFREEVIEGQARRLHGEVLLTQSRGTKSMVAFLAVIMVVLVTFASLGSYARTETVQGILTTDKPIVRIVVNKPGRVLRTFVREGDHVGPGKPLAILDVDIRREGGAALAQESVALLDRQVDKTRAQAANARQSEEMMRRQLDGRITGSREQLSNLARQIVLQEQIVASSRDLLARAQRLVDKGFVSSVELERRRQAAIQTEQQLEMLRQQATDAKITMRQAELERQTARIELARQLSNIDASLAAVERERLTVSSSMAFAVTSPIAGRVTAIQAGVGQTVQPGVVMLTIVPDDAEVQAELYAPSRAIGFVKPGQTVSLLVDAFPYQKFGSVGAKVSGVSATMIDPREAYTPFKIEEPVFKVRVRIDQPVGQRLLKLQPGMTLSASIVLERRSFLDWLLSPLSAVTQRNR